MNLEQIIQELDLTVITEPKDFAQVEPTAGYSSDLLSCVMAGARHNAIWVTLQAHANIVAVGALLELSAIIITEGAQPDDAAVQRANDEGITLLSTPLPTFTVVGQLWELGVRA
ncbi:MAG TPA: DRTGG domain-containing protein [Anaerolineaceae bacterium]|nr:DRTGG domain-containing protein [Anaerolineaceae bacterium]